MKSPRNKEGCLEGHFCMDDMGSTQTLYVQFPLKCHLGLSDSNNGRHKIECVCISNWVSKDYSIIKIINISEYSLSPCVPILICRLFAMYALGSPKY